MKRLFIDLSGSITGLTIEDVETTKTETYKIKVNQFPKITHNRHLKSQMKIKDLDEKIDEIIEEKVKGIEEIEEVIIEAPFVNPRFLNSSESVLKLHGYALYKFRDFKITYIEPNLWKKLVTGNGKANKQDVIDNIRARGIILEKEGEKPDDNMYDSYGLYLAYHMKFVEKEAL